MKTKEVEKKKHPWNYGKRKPKPDEYGNLWCACLYPKLTRNLLPEEKGQAFYILCGANWYH